MAGERGEQGATRRAFGALLADLRSSADDSAWMTARTRFGVSPGHIADVEAGRKWPSRAAVRAYALVSGRTYDELLNLKTQLKADPHGPVAQQLDKTTFQRRWGSQPPELPATKIPAAGDEPMNSVWQFAQVITTKPRQLENVYKVLPWLPAFLVVSATVMSGAPTNLPSHFSGLQSYSREIVLSVFVGCIVMSALASLLTEYAMRYLQTKVRQIPGIRGVWLERNHYVATRAVPAIVEDLRRSGELIEVESAGAAAETLERLSVIAPLTGLVVLLLVRNQGDAAAYWISAAALAAPFVFLPLSVAAVRHALIVMRHAQGDD